jgi:hypothetical protein
MLACLMEHLELDVESRKAHQQQTRANLVLNDREWSLATSDSEVRLA